MSQTLLLSPELPLPFLSNQYNLQFFIWRMINSQMLQEKHWSRNPHLLELAVLLNKTFLVWILVNFHQTKIDIVSTEYVISIADSGKQFIL